MTQNDTYYACYKIKGKNYIMAHKWQSKIKGNNAIITYHMDTENQGQ